MSIGTRAKDAGAVIAGLTIIVAMFAISAALITGAAAFSIWVLEWTFPAFSYTLLATLVVLLPLSFISSTRHFAAIGLNVSASVIALILWLWGMAYTYSVWGMFGVFFGLFLGGIGVVPVAMVAQIWHGDWSNLGAFVFAIFVFFGVNFLKAWLNEKVLISDLYKRETDRVLPATRMEH